MLNSKNQAQFDEFNAIIKNIKALQISEDRTQNIETYSKILSDIDQQFDQIFSKKIQLSSQSSIKNACNQIIMLINLSNRNYLICNNILNFNRTLNVLIRAQKIQYIEFSTDLTPFFINCCFQASTEPKEYSNFKQNLEIFLNSFFTNDRFSFQFFDHSLYQTFFHYFLPKCNNISFLEWIFNIIINLPNKNSFKNEDINLIFQSVQKLYKDVDLKQEVSELFIINVSKLFFRISSINSNCTESFLQNDIPQIFDEKLNSEEKWKETFSILLSSQTNADIGAPNEGIFNFLFNLCLSNQTKLVKNLYKKIFIIKKLEEYECYKCIEKYFPQIQKLLDFLSEIIDDVLKLNYTEFFTNFLQGTFRLFTVQMNDDLLQYSQLISIIKKSKISFDQHPSKFIKCFLRTPSVSTLNNLFNNDFFLDTSLHYFSLPIVKESQPITFQYLYDLNEKKYKILVKFLTIKPTKRLVRCLMNLILSNPTNQGFLIIMTSFHENEEFCEKFVACDGLQFLEKCFKNKYLSLDMFAMIISTLVSHRLFIEVDKFISKLEKNHPLFSLSHKQLENIVYGENSGRFRPLRVPSLFYLLQDKEHIDPYNSYLLGRFGMKSFLKNGYEIYKVPFIKEISNRYLLSKHVDLMMKNPQHFDEFCDNENFDHFSLFVLYPLQDELHFKGDFNSISFWVRFQHKSKKGINYFFNDGNVYLSLDEDEIIIEILTQKSDKMFIGNSKVSQKVSVKIEKKWTHFYITNEDERKSTKKSVFVNGKLQLSCSVSNESKDSNQSVYLYNYGQMLMYIGPAIRFFSKNYISASNNFSNEIYKNGPGYINFFSNKSEQNLIKTLINIDLTNNSNNNNNDNEFIISPFNLYRKSNFTRFPSKIWKEVPSNCYTAPYFGFPFHFLSNRRLSELFKILNSSKDEESFNFIFKTLLSINSIIELNQDRFFRQFLNSMMINRSFVSKQIFMKALQSIFGRQSSKIILHSILFDRDMWAKIDPNMLFEVLFDEDYFKLTDFSNINDYELFLFVIVQKHPECIETLMKNIQKVKNLSKLLLDTLKYKKKNVDIQLAIASNYAKIIKSSSILNESVIFKQIREFLLISVKPLGAEIFNLMTIISIKKKESFTLTNSILYSVMQLVSFESVWNNVYELNKEFNKNYISLLLGLIWSYSYGEIFAITFNDKKFNRSNSYDTKHIYYLRENASFIINDKFCLFLILNFFPILYNVTELAIGKLKTDQMIKFTNSILESFNVVFPKYYTYKPEVTKKYFNESPLIFLYHTILKECKSESKFKMIYFALFVGSPFYNETMYSVYSPVILNSFLMNYTPFPNFGLFLKYLLFTVYQKIPIDQLENILILLFGTCETKYFNIINLLLFAIFNEYFENETIFEILQSEIGTFYNIITSQKSELAWFNLLSSKKDILNILNKFNWPYQLKNLLNNLTSSENSIDLTELKKQHQALKYLCRNELSSINKEFNNNEALYKKNEFNFFKEVSSQIESTLNNSEKVHKLIKKKKSLLSNSIEFVEEKMHWSHFLSSLTDKMTDVSQFDPKSFYLSQKTMPYKCPSLFSPLIFSSKEEATELFTNVINDSKKNNNVNVDLFMKSESLPEKIIIVECKICRYKYEIPSVMFFDKSGISFLTFSELATENEITLIDKQNYDFITSVLAGQWGTTSLFSRHIVIKINVDEIIFIQFIKYKAINIWSFKHGQFMVKFDSNKLKQIKYSISMIASNAMESFSPYSFLFKIEDFNAAFYKWSKYEISTDDLLLVSNGLSRRSFTNLKSYPYFPFIFSDINNSNQSSSLMMMSTLKSNISLTENSNNNLASSNFLFKSNISLNQSSSSGLFISALGSSQILMTTDMKLYSIPSSSNETTTLMRSALPFGKMISSDFSQINKADIITNELPKAESASDLQSSISYGNEIGKTYKNIKDEKNTELNDKKHEDESLIIGSKKIVSSSRLISKELSDYSGEEDSDSRVFNSTGSDQIYLESLNVNKKEKSSPPSPTNSNSNIANQSNMTHSDSNLIPPRPNKFSNLNFFTSLFQKVDNNTTASPPPLPLKTTTNDDNSDRINRTRITSFSSTNSTSVSPLNLSTKKRIKRYSDAPSSFFKSPITPQNNQSILVDNKNATREQLDTIIRIFAEPITESFEEKIDSEKEKIDDNESNPFRFTCPANFFYSPEIFKNISKNPYFCVQKHRESLENVNNSQFIAGWIIEHIIGDSYTSKMKRKNSQRTYQFNNVKHIFSLDLIHMSQKLKKGCKPSKTFIFTSDNKLKRIKRLSMRIFDSYFAIIDKKDLSLSIIDFSNNMKKTATTILCYRDKFFALSKSISVSLNGLFISVDYQFGVTRVYRILYSKGSPSSIEFLSDFSSNMSPTSVIDGNRWICATASSSQLVLWNIFDGTLHRVLNFGSSKITAISMDEESGIWVATENNGYFISINGEILSEIQLPEEISTIKAISIHSSVSDRAAACGTISGKIYLLNPRIDTKTIDTKELKGGHSHEITQIIVNKNSKMFITVDNKNNSVLWTAKGLSCEGLNISMFEKCPLCNQKPVLCCTSCNRSICKKCSFHGLCLTCYSLS